MIRLNIGKLILKKVHIFIEISSGIILILLKINTILSLNKIIEIVK